MLGMPRPYLVSSGCSDGLRWREVKPEACRAGQNLLPGLAKCQPVAAEYRPGLIPTNRTRNSSAAAGSTSGIVASFAASRSSFNTASAPYKMLKYPGLSWPASARHSRIPGIPGYLGFPDTWDSRIPGIPGYLGF